MKLITVNHCQVTPHVTDDTVKVTDSQVKVSHRWPRN